MFLTMAEKFKKDIVPVARDLGNLGFGLVATCEYRDGWAAPCCLGLPLALLRCHGSLLSVLALLHGRRDEAIGSFQRDARPCMAPTLTRPP